MHSYFLGWHWHTFSFLHSLVILNLWNVDTLLLEVRTGSFVLESDMPWDSRVMLHHQWYPVIACISVSLLQLGMLFRRKQCSQCITNQGNWFEEPREISLSLFLKLKSIWWKDWTNVMYYRTSPADFIVPYDQYMESVKNNYSIGMRFKMRFEGEEAPEQRYVSITRRSIFLL